MECQGITILQEKLKAFSKERDWDKFHNPKNLVMALSREASELLEHFQWLTFDESLALAKDDRRHVAHEAADVFLYLLQLCEILNIDLIASAHEKMRINAEKHPVPHPHPAV